MFCKTRTHLLSIFSKTFSRNRRKGQTCVFLAKNFSSESTDNPMKRFDFGAGYTEDEKSAILKAVNTSEGDELQRYNITASRMKKINAYRDRNGFFKTVDEILLLQGIDINVLDNFCKSILRHEEVPKSRGIIRSKADLLIPPLDEDIRIAMETCTGIWVCGDLISWAQLDIGCNLLQWECQRLDEAATKEGFVAFIDSVAGIVSKVSPSHAYVMESEPIVPFSRMTGKNYTVHLQKQQIMTTIASILGTRERRLGDPDDGISDTWINNIYMMRSRTPARLYNLVIGSEIVSAENVVEKIITNSQDKEDNININVHVDPDMKKYYKSRDIYEREQMNWSLLLITAFMNLSVLKTALLKREIVKRARK